MIRPGWWFGLGVVVSFAQMGCRQPAARLAVPTTAVVHSARSTTETNEPPLTRLVAWQNTREDSTTAFPQDNDTDAPSTTAGSVEQLQSDLPALELPEPDGSVTAELPLPTLQLDEVLQSVSLHYPLLQVALAERQIASGKELATLGEFDTALKSYSLATPVGYYENYRSLVGISQPLVPGGYVYSGYRIGRGEFQPWYREYNTNDGGELSAGLALPLLQNRAIDKRRSALAQARYQRLATDPAVQSQWLEFARLSAQAYWNWVAAGRAFEAQERLLELAQRRVEQLQQRVDAGDLQQIAVIDNQRFIASRETKLIETRRKFQESSIKLSLFLRTDFGEPQLVDLQRVPRNFPPAQAPASEQLEADISAALAARPELRELDFLIRSTQVEITQARNQMLPKLDATLEASQDVGGKASSLGDKSPLDLEAGVLGELPLQRREARGKIRAASGKLMQLRAKREFVVNKTVAAVQDAYSAQIAAQERGEQAWRNVELARQSLTLGRDAFRAGDIDLIVLNIYEQAVTDAELIWIDARADYFRAVADYEAILARNLLPL